MSDHVADRVSASPPSAPLFDLEARACPVCGSKDGEPYAEEKVDATKLNEFAFSSRKAPEHMHFRLVRCPRCDVLYANPAPTRAALEAAYREAAFDAGRESTYAARTYGRLLKPLLPKLPSRQGALDIGTGDGAFLQELLDQGFTEVEGAEPSEAPVASASPAIRALIRNAPFRASDYKAGQFSLISCFQTIEHVMDPLALCREVFATLRPGGAIFLVCHNRRGLLNRVLGERSPIFDIEHLQLFSPDSMRALLQEAGFTDIRVKPVVNRYPIAYWSRLFPAPPRVKAPVLRALERSGLGAVALPFPVGNLAAFGFRPR